MWKKPQRKRWPTLRPPPFPIILLLKAGLAATVEQPLFTDTGGFQSVYDLHTAQMNPRGGGTKGTWNLAHTSFTRPCSGVELRLPRGKKRLILCSKALLWTELCLRTPQFICWRPNYQCDGRRRWRLWGWSPHTLITAPLRRDTRALASSFSSHTPQGKAMWGHNQKAAVSNSRRELSTDANPAGTMMSDFQPPELWKINFCLSYPVCGILLWQLELTKTGTCRAASITKPQYRMTGDLASPLHVAVPTNCDSISFIRHLTKF